VLRISIWGIEAFSGGLSGDGTKFWAPCDSVPPRKWGICSAADTALFATHWKAEAKKTGDRKQQRLCLFVQVTETFSR